MKLNTLRPRRLRLSAPLRAMVRENHVCLNDLIYPIFVVPGTNVKEEIPSMPGCYHLSVDNAVRLAEDIYALGLRAIEVFGCRLIRRLLQTKELTVIMITHHLYDENRALFDQIIEI